jgi:hypothetical protein
VQEISHGGCGGWRRDVTSLLGDSVILALFVISVGVIATIFILYLERLRKLIATTAKRRLLSMELAVLIGALSIVFYKSTETLTSKWIWSAWLAYASIAYLLVTSLLLPLTYQVSKGNREKTE